MLKRRLGLLLLLLLLLLMGALIPDSPADAADTEGSGLRADTLTVRVGYYGGPFYEKKIFTIEELWGLNVYYGDYTYIDAMPSVVIDHVAGVRLSDLLKAAGIDPGSVQQLHFWTNDKASGYFNSFMKTELLDQPRYCYYNLPSHYDIDTGLEAEGAAEGAEPVPTVLALADDWNRVMSGAEFGSDYLNLDTNTRFRLIFGQTSVSEQAASRSAKWIHSVEVVLGGAPTITMDAAALELEVGSVFRISARIQAADPTIAQALQLTWSSSDPSVVSVDGAGNIRVQSEGQAVITASAGGASAQITINALPGEGGPVTTETNPGQESGAAETEGGETVTGGGETETEVILATGENEPSASPLPPTAATGDDRGGVQNWRVFAMSETAVELAAPVMDSKPALWAGLASLLLFVLGFLLRLWRYNLDIVGTNINRPKNAS